MHIRLLCPAAGVLPHQTLAVVHHRTTARAPLCRAFFFESWKHENHEMNGNGASNAAQQHTPVTFSIDGRLPRPTPLGTVVNDAVHRWFLDTQREAFRGDVKQQALLGQMLIEGYGCEADPLQGREWVEKARRRGYRTSGVYCEL